MPDDQFQGGNPNDTNPFNRPNDQVAQPRTDEEPASPFQAPVSSDDTPPTVSEPMTNPVASDSPSPSTSDASPNTPPVAPVPAFDTEPATQPAVMPAMTEATFAQPSPEKKSKKGLIIGGIVGVIALLGIGGSAAAYNLWYQNPDKVIVDSVVNAMKAKSAKINGTFKWSNDDVAVTLAPTMAGNKSEGSVATKVTIESKSEETAFLDGVTINSDVVYQKDGTLYLRVSNVKATFDKLADSYIEDQLKQSEAMGVTITDEQKAQAEQQFKAMFQPIVDKIDGQWLKLDANKESSTSDDQKCFSDAYEKFGDEKLAREVGDVYYQHKFVTVKNKLGSENGNLGYELELDEKKAEEFGKAFEKTEIGKELAKCDENESSRYDSDDTTEEDVFKKTSLKVWITRWSHELAKVTFEGEMADEDGGNVSADFTTVFNQDVKVTVPKDAKTFEEVFEGFDPFSLGAMSAAAPTEI